MPIAGGTVRTIAGVTRNWRQKRAKLRGGVLEVDSTFSPTAFTRALGQINGQVNWSSGPNDAGSGGFSAFGGSLTVNLGGNAIPQSVTWGSTNDFVQDGHALIFGSTKSNNTVIWQNPINLGGNSSPYESREIRVIGGTGVTADRTRIDGVISGTAATTELLKTGSGVLELTAANTYQGNTLAGRQAAREQHHRFGDRLGMFSSPRATLGGGGFVVPSTPVRRRISSPSTARSHLGNSVGTLTIGSAASLATTSIAGNYAWKSVNPAPAAAERAAAAPPRITTSSPLTARSRSRALEDQPRLDRRQLRLRRHL